MRLLAAAIGVGLIGSLGACGGSDDRTPTASETKICATLQRIVDDLSAKRNESALATLSELKLVTAQTDNAVLAQSSSSFFDELFTDIDYTQLTIEETAAYGQQYLASMSTTLGEMIDECGRVGAPIERLPAA